MKKVIAISLLTPMLAAGIAVAADKKPLVQLNTISQVKDVTFDEATQTASFVLKNGLQGSVVLGSAEFRLAGSKVVVSDSTVKEEDKILVPQEMADVLNIKDLADVVIHEKGLLADVITYANEPLQDGKTTGRSFDLNAYVPINGSEEGWLYTSNETRPGGGFLQRVTQNNNGFYSVAESKRVNFDEVGGTWNNCAGNITPWGTVLSGEERVGSSVSELTALKQIAAANGEVFSEDPYNFGYIVEINPFTGNVQKLKAMGRMKYEAAIVLPDEKTAFATEDSGGGILTKFVADNPRDLTSGNLYAAKFDKEANKVEWIEIPEAGKLNLNATAKALGATGFDRPEDIEYNPFGTQSSRKQPNNKRHGID